MARSDLTVRARRLRRDQTEAEARLWQALRDGQLNGIGFRRQHPVAGFVVDFCAPQQKLIVELGGGQHDELEQRVFDERRAQDLQDQGYCVIPFWNNEGISRAFWKRFGGWLPIYPHPGPRPSKGEGTGPQTFTFVTGLSVTPVSGVTV